MPSSKEEGLFVDVSVPASWMLLRKGSSPSLSVSTCRRMLACGLLWGNCDIFSSNNAL